MAVCLRFHLSVNHGLINYVLQAKKRLQKANARASQTAEETAARKVQDRVRKASMRASQTVEETAARKMQNRVHMASMRASQTAEETVA